MTDDLAIPGFLRLPTEERRAWWKANPPRKATRQAERSAFLKPRGMPWDEWTAHQRQAERERKAKQKARLEMLRTRNR